MTRKPRIIFVFLCGKIFRLEKPFFIFKNHKNLCSISRLKMEQCTFTAMHYLKELNEQQREAVIHKDGPIMIVAGAGSGKTKVLTTRIAHLMSEHNIDSFNILALTFTNKAAAEMKERVEKILGNREARNLYIGTFHSVFARILRSEAQIGRAHV